ncbi:VOC family protein [Caenimonas aquaedulcis]|uniref:VOC family protein n=1 Tax=Caenimonas aquaedulcis TaxID=2793270 RepID=A0A931H3C8_9BURK|nr:VOC family protein [Caenimonas aquaedulcis]MBG9387750.1 VOC family protein [Caenimonas aquaedulcis]
MPMLDSYLFFNGDCRAAMTFYQEVIGGQMMSMMTYAQSPDPNQCGAEGKDRIMHAHLLVDGRNLMASDAPPGQPVPAQGGFALSLNYPSAGEAKKAFDAFAEGGKVTMPMSKTFWIESFGMVTDKFGTPWMVGGGEAAKG